MTSLGSRYTWQSQAGVYRNTAEESELSSAVFLYTSLVSLVLLPSYRSHLSDSN